MQLLPAQLHTTGVIDGIVLLCSILCCFPEFQGASSIKEAHAACLSAAERRTNLHFHSQQDFNAVTQSSLRLEHCEPSRVTCSVSLVTELLQFGTRPSASCSWHATRDSCNDCWELITSLLLEVREALNLGTEGRREGEEGREIEVSYNVFPCTGGRRQRCAWCQPAGQIQRSCSSASTCSACSARLERGGSTASWNQPPPCTSTCCWRQPACSQATARPVGVLRWWPRGQLAETAVLPEQQSPRGMVPNLQHPSQQM